MERRFDLVVIGTGAAGSAAAYKCRKAGWDVATGPDAWKGKAFQQEAVR